MAAERTAGDFGRTLREARERRGISLRQIANATKISVSALEALERNDLSRLPGGIFSRAFVRSYALEVGLEPDQAIQDFIGQLPQDAVAAGHPVPTISDDHEAIESNRRVASAVVRLLAISLPIAAVVVYFAAAGLPSTAPRSTDTEPAIPPTPTPAPALPDSGLIAPPLIVDAMKQLPAAATVQSSSGAAAAALPNVLVVELEATASSWVSITVDGENTVARQYLAGERQTIKAAREVVLTASDPATLRVTLNGAPAATLGNPGQVVTRRLTPANFKDYLAKR